jgi:hypothetical protein
MATFSKVKLSGSTNGRGIRVAGTATGTATTIHATTTSATIIDELWLYAFNSDTTTIVLTIELGGTTAPDDNIVVSIPSRSGLTLVVPGLILTGTGSAATTVRAFAGTIDKIILTGYVHRIS